MRLPLLLVLLFASAAAYAQELYFARLPDNVLNYLYQTRKVEFAVCLHGSTSPKAVKVERVEFTYISSYSGNSVTAEPCPADQSLLGMAHSHPDGDCRFSKADVAVFLDRADHPFDFVVCENNQINWMNREEAQALLPQTRMAAPSKDAVKLEGLGFKEIKFFNLTDKPR